MPRITPYAIEQAAIVAHHLAEGRTHREIAQIIGKSRPRVSQVRKRLAELAPYLNRPADPSEHLLNHRTQLHSLQRQVLELAAAIRRELHAIDDVRESAQVDKILGIR